MRRVILSPLYVHACAEGTHARLYVIVTSVAALGSFFFRANVSDIIRSSGYLETLRNLIVIFEGAVCSYVMDASPNFSKAYVQTADMRELSPAWPMPSYVTVRRPDASLA